MRLFTKLRGLAAVTAALLCGTTFAEKAEAQGRYTVECRAADGSLRWAEPIKNLVPTGGKNNLLDSFLSGSSYTAAFYLGLVDGASAPAFNAADTLASHSGWNENQGYSNGGRPSVTFASAAAGSKASSGVVFNINAGGTIAGVFLATNATKGGTTGVLISAGAFAAGSRVLQAGDTLTVTYTLSV